MHIGLQRLILFFVMFDVFSCRQIPRKFPDIFEFGVSTAAYQIEGAWNEDGKGLSIWDVMTHSVPSPIADKSTGDVAADSYHQYKRDVELLRELHVDFYRFSISWTRILPNGFSNNINLRGIAYYNRLIDDLTSHGIRPIGTIYHWDLPNDLQKLGGWTNPSIVQAFVDYAYVLFDSFGDRIKQWITFNEAKQICLEGYGSDQKAPMLNLSGIAEYMCAKNVLLAHAKTYKMYEDKFRKRQNGTVGISVSFTWYEPMSASAADRQAALDANQFDWGQHAHPIFSIHGDFPDELKENVASKSRTQGFARSRLPELSAEEVALIRGSADFLGVNSYTTKMAFRDASLEGMYATPSYMDDMSAVLVKDDSWPQSRSPWLQEVPWGFYKLLKKIAQLYDNPPAYITENGWSTNGGLVDEDRIRYCRSYLNAVLDAIREGCDIRGYSTWSLLDNFEWENGYTEKFGLYEVDFNDAARRRTPRKSSFIYRQIAKTKVLDFNYEPENYTTHLGARSSEENYFY